jgi:hypothetical protein
MFCIAIIGTSCTKEETTTAEPGTGMISLELEVNNNEANDTLASTDTDELVPAGTVIQFTMDTRDYQLNPDGNYNYEMKTWTATVDDQGMVSISLPAISKDADVTVKYPDLSLTKTWRIGIQGSNTNPRRDTTATKIYERADDVYTIFDGADIKVLDGNLYSEK